MSKKQKIAKLLYFYKKNPGICIGAVRADKGAGIPKKNHSSHTHQILKELVASGDLKKCQKGEGFKYNPV